MDSRITFKYPPGFDATPGLEQNTMNGVQRSAPAWNREQLISQFQGIDGSTRIEAERQIADLERSFRTGIADIADAGGRQDNGK